MPRVLLPALFLLVGALPACTGCEAARSQGVVRGECTFVRGDLGPPGESALTVDVVASGLEVPWGVAFLPDGDLLLTERPGRIRLIEEGRLVPEPVATVQVDPGGEGGLQGLALHPDFATNRLFFIYFTHVRNGRTVNRLERWRLAENHRSAKAEKTLLQDIPAAQYHHGGRLRVGPDRMLYVSVGDAGAAQTAQDARALTGKLLRLTPDGEVPADNPLPGNPLWLSGVRNTQGFDWRDTKTLVLTDHGPTGELGRIGQDEVSFATRGANLGWPKVSGCQPQPGAVTPRLAWEYSAPPGGAALYTGDAIPEWKGSLLIGLLRASALHRVVFDAAGRVVRHEQYLQGAKGHGRLREVMMGPDGHLYVTTSNCDGRGECPKDKDRVLRVRR